MKFESIMKRRGLFIGSRELLEDLMAFQYDLYIEMLHNAKIFITSMDYPDISHFRIECVSPYFIERNPGDDPIVYKFQLTKTILNPEADLEQAKFRFGYKILTQDDQLIYEGK